MNAAPLCASGFAVTDVAGYKAHTVARSTRTLVILADTAEFGLSVDDGGRYLLVCDPHGGILQSDAAATARYYLRHPEEWCPTCQDSD
jgi:hypothetical protein